MLCPKCNSKSVVSQVRDNGRRRRNCTNHLCQHTFHTQESVVEPHTHGGLRPGAFGTHPRVQKEPA